MERDQFRHLLMQHQQLIEKQQATIQDLQQSLGVCRKVIAEQFEQMEKLKNKKQH
jgi:hypothetical protein